MERLHSILPPDHDPNRPDVVYRNRLATDLVGLRNRTIVTDP